MWGTKWVGWGTNTYLGSVRKRRKAFDSDILIRIVILKTPPNLIFLIFEVEYLTLFTKMSRLKFI